MDYRSWSLEEQVAQLFMLGYSGEKPNVITRRFLERGLGGLIFFRDNFDSLQPLNAPAIHELLAGLSAAVPAHLPRPLLGIDQEGGQVERLPHTVFPTALTPLAVAMAPQPEALARDMYGIMAAHLRQLGFTLDFFPTLDVNLNPKNPIIGVRSFGNNPETVWRLGKTALQEFEKAGVVTVGKHFPGHGNGTVDSHLDLPTLIFTEEELKPFQQAIDAGLPAMLVAHGYYPALQTTPEERALPSSASPAVIQGLLRERCGFEGVLITDDMCMGAITQHRSPVEAALASLRAGVDILLYKQSTEDEWAVYQATLEAFRSEDLPMSQLYQSLERITRLKARLSVQTPPPFNPMAFTPEACRMTADGIALRGIGLLSGERERLPINPDTALLLVHPDRRKLGNYAFDVPTSDELDAVIRQAGFSQISSIIYPTHCPFSASDLLQSVEFEPQAICMIGFNAWKQADQTELYTKLRNTFPKAPIILVSAGMPDSPDILPNPDLHLSLCSYRPASVRALAQILRHGLPALPAIAGAQACPPVSNLAGQGSSGPGGSQL
ncbi:MAG TPA: glycoside hydrolase family 3 N-terminal domain-containing protein [Coleofasciculaceae cyanobacterium]|jgi:beta-N-acetylhexosaminidase